MITYYIGTYIFFLGLCVGSFLNVCIYRLPNEASIIRPRSMCPQCKNPIPFYDNIPVLSYLLLMGKCRSCKTFIPIRYPLVELLTGLLALSVYATYGLSYEWLIYFTFIAALIVITFIDIDHQIIPNIISLPGIPIFFLATYFLPDMTFVKSLIGILVGGGSLYLVAWGYHAFTGKEGMGMGDVKLLAMIGALVGWKGVLFTIFVGSAIGCVVGIFVMLRTQKNMKLAVPFGPFLSIGAITHLFFGPELIYWYLNIMR
jgi:leader peptidase (prepilin peptidase) / N-methyltransferase